MQHHNVCPTEQRSCIHQIHSYPLVVCFLKRVQESVEGADSFHFPFIVLSQ